MRRKPMQMFRVFDAFNHVTHCNIRPYSEHFPALQRQQASALRPLALLHHHYHG